MTTYYYRVVAADGAVYYPWAEKFDAFDDNVYFYVGNELTDYYRDPIMVARSTEPRES